MKTYHISDLHFVASDNGDLLRKLTQLRGVMTEDDILLVTGDVTDNGRADEYLEASRGLSHWAGRILLVPGNHDYGRAGLTYSYEAYKRWGNLMTELHASGPPHRQVVQIATTKYILLDSCLHTAGLFPLDLARGHLTPVALETIEKVAGLRRQSGYRRLVVAFHHHPFLLSKFDQMTLGMENYAEVRRVTYGLADRVVFGHLHHGEREWYVAMHRDLPESEFVRTRYEFCQSFDTLSLEEVVSWEN